MFRHVKECIPAVSLDTVYRSLVLLERLGLLTRVHILGDRTRFDANTLPHHHFVCSKCGLIKDFLSSGPNSFRIPAEVRSWGEIKSVHVQVHGECSQCVLAGEDVD
ncbi:transcriptional repressor [Thermodesulfobacteriota bacterium]